MKSAAPLGRHWLGDRSSAPGSKQSHNFSPTLAAKRPVSIPPKGLAARKPEDLIAPSEIRDRIEPKMRCEQDRNIDIVRIFDVNYVDLAWLPCGPLNAQPSHPSPVKSLALARPPFYPYEFPHSCSNCAEYWTISDIGRKLPLCPSQNAHWAHARGHQEEYWSFTAPISTCWVPVSLDSTERNPSRASTRNSVESPSARGLPWKRFKATTRER